MEQKFPVKFNVSKLLNSILFPILKENQNEMLDWQFLLEFGNENGVPNYQAYLELKSLSDMKRVINDSFHTFNSIKTKPIKLLTIRIASFKNIHNLWKLLLSEFQYTLIKMISIIDYKIIYLISFMTIFLRIV